MIALLTASGTVERGAADATEPADVTELDRSQRSRPTPAVWLVVLGLAVAAAIVAGLVMPGTASAKDKVKAKTDKGTLTITGTGGSDILAFRLRAGDPTTLEIDVGDDGSVDLDFKRDKFDHFVATVGNGDDVVRIDDVNGAFTDTEVTTIDGGAGDDTLTGGSDAETFFGQAGNDTITGLGGGDVLHGGDGDDVLTGGDGDDQVLGEAGNDRMIWNPGDDTDLNKGGDGIDVVEVNGGNGAEVFTTTANGPRVRFDRVSPAPFSIDVGTTENLALNTNGGDDSFSPVGNLAALILLSVDGGAGEDNISGSNGSDLLLGGDGNDVIDGQQGNDTALMGAGDDVFQWDPGDGSDTVEGQADTDTMVFNGANVAEVFDLSANGQRVRLTRNVANITMDLDDVEYIDLITLGGPDTVTANDVSGTDLVQVNASLAAAGGGGDAQPDTVIVNGTNGDDVILVAGDAGGVAVFGLAAQVDITGAEAANDTLTINALAGDDVVEASGLAAGAIRLVADGGDDDDILLGSAGDDILSGGNGDDILLGGPGIDLLDGGPGDNVLIQD